MEEPIKVMITDDNEVVREGLKSIFEAQKDILVVGQAVDGQDAVEKAGKLQPDVILMDGQMPRMDGLHLTTLIKKEVRLAGVPVFIFSSLASEANNRKWKNIGADGIITKPDLPRLVQILADALVTSPAAPEKTG